MKVGEKVAALRLIDLKTESREKLAGGIIEVQNRALKYIMKCDCGRADFEVWSDDFKGENAQIFSDCGCGIWTKKQAETLSDNDIVESRYKERKFNRKIVQSVYLDLELSLKVDELAKQKEISISKAFCTVLRAGFEKIEGGK